MTLIQLAKAVEIDKKLKTIGKVCLLIFKEFGSGKQEKDIHVFISTASNSVKCILQDKKTLNDIAIVLTKRVTELKEELRAL